jgi:hypothetical protein
MVPGALAYRMSIARANMSVKSSTKMIPANVLFIIHHSLLYQPHLCLKLYFKFPKAIQKGSASSMKKNRREFKPRFKPTPRRQKFVADVSSRFWLSFSEKKIEDI